MTCTGCGFKHQAHSSCDPGSVFGVLFVSATSPHAAWNWAEVAARRLELL